MIGRERDAIANIERLTGQIEKLKRERDDARADVATLQVWNNDKNIQVARLQGQLTAAEERASTAEHRLTLLEGAINSAKAALSNGDYKEAWEDLERVETCSICNKSFVDCACTAEQKTAAWRDWFKDVTTIDAALTPAPATTERQCSRCKGVAIPFYTRGLDIVCAECFTNSTAGAPATTNKRGDRFLAFANSLPVPPTSVLATCEPGETQGTTSLSVCVKCGQHHPAGLDIHRDKNGDWCTPPMQELRAERDKLRADLEAANSEVTRLRDQVTRNMAVHDAELVKVAKRAEEAEAGAAAMREALQSLANLPVQERDSASGPMGEHVVTLASVRATKKLIAEGGHGIVIQAKDVYRARRALQDATGRSFLERLQAAEERGKFLDKCIDEARASLALAHQRADAEGKRRVTAEGALGRAVAAAQEAARVSAYECPTHHMTGFDALCAACLAKNAGNDMLAPMLPILADPTCAAAGEAWREMYNALLRVRDGQWSEQGIRLHAERTIAVAARRGAPAPAKCWNCDKPATSEWSYCDGENRWRRWCGGRDCGAVGATAYGIVVRPLAGDVDTRRGK